MEPSHADFTHDNYSIRFEMKKHYSHSTKLKLIIQIKKLQVIILPYCITFSDYQHACILWNHIVCDCRCERDQQCQ